MTSTLGAVSAREIVQLGPAWIYSNAHMASQALTATVP